MSEIQYFHDLADLPLDEWNGEDGDNSVLANLTPVAPKPEDIDVWAEWDKKALANPVTLILVPHKRDIKPGMIGKDVLGMKRALSSAGFGPWGGWGSKPRLYGPYAVRNLKAFQKKRGLKADGVYGKATHAALSRYYDDYGRWLAGQAPRTPVPISSKRTTIVSTAMLGYRNRYSIHYTQSSWRMQGVRYRLKPPAFPRYEDCSSFATWTYWVAGVSDPNGLGYNGWGFTGTLASHGRSISTTQMKPGDLIFYGRYPHSHVTIYVGNGRCVSHGSEVGPLLLPYNYRTVNSIRSYI